MYHHDNTSTSLSNRFEHFTVTLSSYQMHLHWGSVSVISVFFIALPSLISHTCFMSNYNSTSDVFGSICQTFFGPQTEDAAGVSLLWHFWGVTLDEPHQPVLHKKWHYCLRRTMAWFCAFSSQIVGPNQCSHFPFVVFVVVVCQPTTHFLKSGWEKVCLHTPSSKQLAISTSLSVFQAAKHPDKWFGNVWQNI